MQGRLSDDVVVPRTILNPPLPQEMQVPIGPYPGSINGEDEGNIVQVRAL